MWQNVAQSVASGATVTVAFDTVSYDPNGNLTTGAGAKYTCPVDGYYQVNLGVELSGQSTTGMLVAIYQNGSDVAEVKPAQVAQGGTVSDVLLCAAGDTIQGVVSENGGALNTVAGSFRTFLSVHYLSPK